MHGWRGCRWSSGSAPGPGRGGRPSAGAVPMLGSREEGVRRPARDNRDVRARLPTTGAMPSLDVSHAAAVGLRACAMARSRAGEALRMRLRVFLTIGLVMSQSLAAAADNPLDRLASEITARDPGVPSVVAHARSPRHGIDWTGASRGVGETGPEPLAGRPFRIASVTKLFVAAAVLRLVELERLSLDRAIGPSLSDGTRALLVDGGYDPGRITISQLLSHTGGLSDHSTLPSFLQAIFANGQRRWTRGEQIALAMTEGRKVAEPGEQQAYSDTGYLLLAEIIEGQTARPLASSIRHLLRFDRLGLEETWFETLEVPPPSLPPRLKQYLGKADVTDFDPSFDLWGGGGIVSTVGDLALFMRAFVTGRLFDRPETLALAIARPGSTPAPGQAARAARGRSSRTPDPRRCGGSGRWWRRRPWAR